MEKVIADKFNGTHSLPEGEMPLGDKLMAAREKADNPSEGNPPASLKKAFNDDRELVPAKVRNEKSLHEKFSAQSGLHSPKALKDQINTPAENLSPIEKVAKFFYDNKIGGKADRIAELAMRGNAQAKKDLWYLINNQKEGIPKNEELWQAGFELLQEAAAEGNKQAISDLAYVKYHGIHGIKADRQEALELMKKIGCTTKYDAFERWQPGYKKAHGIGIKKEPEPEAAAATKPDPKPDPNLEPEPVREKYQGPKIYDGSTEELVDNIIKERGLDPEECMEISVPNGGEIINCELRAALWKQGVGAPEECDIESRINERSGKPSYIITVPPPAEPSINSPGLLHNNP